MRNDFENPERTRLIYKLSIEKREKKLKLAQQNLDEKGENATTPDKMAVYSAQVSLDMLKESYEKFEAELKLHQISQDENQPEK